MLPEAAEEKEWKVLKETRKRSQKQQARWTELQTRRKVILQRGTRNNRSDDQREQITLKRARGRAKVTTPYGGEGRLWQKAFPNPTHPNPLSPHFTVES